MLNIYKWFDQKKRNNFKYYTSKNPLLSPALAYSFIKQHWVDQRGTSAELANQIKQKNAITELRFILVMLNVYKWFYQKNRNNFKILYIYESLTLSWFGFFYLLSNTKYINEEQT